MFLYIISLAIVVLSFFLFFQKSNNNQSLNYRMSGQIIEVIKTVPMAINDRENFIRHTEITMLVIGHYYTLTDLKYFQKTIKL